ncbi:MAG: UbiA family prenyltransferase, partial [Candidatus Dadabacteria bacterium]
VHQWSKNLLLFVPLIMAHKVAELDLLKKTLIAFFFFSFTASTVYVINDLFDRKADANHPLKKNRPFASGVLGVLDGGILILFCAVLGFFLALKLPLYFQELLALYFVTTFIYSFKAKKLLMADVVLLGCLYSLRILCGGAASEVPVSQWLLAFSLFIFFSLAAVKRYCELMDAKEQNNHSISRRGYAVSDLEIMGILGGASGVVSVLILVLYISSEDVGKLYSSPQILWFLTPLILYWISRIWVLAARGEVHLDPVVFAMKDKVSYVIALLCGLVIWLAV